MNFQKLGTLSHFAIDEIIRPSQKPVQERGVLKCHVPFGLVNRNIYVYLEAKFTGSAASYVLACEVEVFAEGVSRGRFPVQIGDIHLLSTRRSLISMVNGGGSAVSNSAAIKLAAPFDTVNTIEATLQPYQIQAEANLIVLHLDGFEEQTSTIPGWRALM